MNNNLEDFLKNITIDPSIKSIGQLYSKYEEVAKEFKLVIDGFQVRINGSLVDKLLFFSLRMKGLGGNDDDAANLFLCYDRSKIGITEKDDVYIDDYERTVYEVGKRTKTNYVPTRDTTTKIIERDTTTKIKEEEKETYGWPLINPDKYKNKTNDPLYKKITNKISGPLYCYYGAIEPNAQARFLSYFFAVFNKEDLSPIGLQEQLDKLCSKAYEISAQIRNKHASNLMVLVKRETVKSAKAAIMSRNMSHNLGSHVMFYIKQRLESVEKMLQTGSLKDLEKAGSIKEIEDKIKKENEIKEWLESLEKEIKNRDVLREALKKFENLNSIKDIENKIKDIKDVITADTPKNEIPFLVGLGRFINYLQERQDFIATVATNYIPYCTTVNFKDAIYDELKPDKRIERHKGPDTRGIETKNLLLDYIAYSEGFTSSDRIELQFKKDNGWFDGSGKPEDVPEMLRNFNVALPGGDMGRQALFSIMENIIRNTAKHDKCKADGNLIFRFERLNAGEITELEGFCLRDGEFTESKEGYCLREGEKDIDSLQGHNDTKCYVDWQNDFHYLGITVALEGDAQETINKIKKCLRRDYLTLDGRMDDECKGVKEIRISAAWLRGKEIDDAIPFEEPPAVAIRKNEEGYLQYIVCLPKPKKIAFILDKNSNTPSTEEKGFKVFPLDKFGCRIFDRQLLDNDDWERKKERCKIADFDLIVCNKTDFKLIRCHVGSRVLIVESVSTILAQYNSLNKKGVLEEVEDFIDGLYLLWLQQEFPNDMDVKLSVCDDKAYHNKIETSQKILDKIECSESSSTTEAKYYDNKVLFSTHYPGQAAANAIVEKESLNKGNSELFPKARFVEAISGGNSTDRLIRHDKRDAPWYCRHIAAGLSQVAIFDERLFSLITPEDNMEIISNVKKHLDEHPNCSAEDFVYDIEINGQKLNDEQKMAVFENLENRPVNFDNCIDSLRFLASDYSKTWRYREKGIWTFDIQIEKKQESDEYDDVAIVGYTVPPTRKEIGVYNPDVIIDTLAHIRRNGSEIEIIPANDSLVKDFEFKKFDFISIHQGLLEKVYEALKIKEDSTCKKLVTNALYDAFSIHAKTEDNKGGFLPQFIIHSGRSKPNENDMPQHLPFLQFSAIDHAVRDCKHTLTELLYSAHYEQ